MPNLKVRKPAFDFTNDVPFQWQPSNPGFATFLNALSFFFVGFERYIIKALRDAMPMIKDPTVLEEARLFFDQEAAHSQAHKLHIDAMVKKYPGLQNTLGKVCAHFDHLYKTKSTNYHLAYIANLEATFPPVLAFVINHRESLFSQGDARISSLFLWHSIEEIEHRSSAFVIYNAVVGNRWYRITQAPSLALHLKGFFDLIMDEFEQHVPELERTAGMTSVPEPLQHISPRERTLLMLRIIRCAMPWHDPADESPPEWFNEWMEADQQGVDMTHFYGRRS